MEKLKLRKLQMKEQVLLPPNLHDIRSGLALDYDFEERGGTVIDQSGNGNHGTIVGATRASGYGDLSAVRGDGVDDNIIIPDPNIANKSFSWTIISKVFNGNYNRYLISQNPLGDVNESLHIGYSGYYGGKFAFNFRSNDLVANNLYDDIDKWIIWSGTYDVDTNDRRLYRNGALENNNIASADYAGIGDMFLMVRATTYTNCDIAYFKMYVDKVLSAEQIKNQYLYIIKIAGKI